MRFDYDRYLCSRSWALKREAVKARAGNICERCKSAPIRDVHHLSYENVGQEDLADLEGLCRPCHEFLSAVSDHDPAPRCQQCQEEPAIGGADPSLRSGLRLCYHCGEAPSWVREFC
jgi:hypothetical protein